MQSMSRQYSLQRESNLPYEVTAVLQSYPLESHGSLRRTQPSGKERERDEKSKFKGQEQSQEVGGIDGVPWQDLRLRHGPERGGGGPEKRAVDPGGGPRSDELCGGSWRGAMELSRPLLGYVAHLL
ncbi:hypothetical protein GW17_00023240 [Ensete ventricosum]|nr:hypothetical protein GW17_00023240 [Ensete ventricosum]